jgi:twitching motility protein PilT
MNSIHELLEIALSKNASDLLVAAGSRPAIRVDGRMEIMQREPFSNDDAEDLIHSIINCSIRDLLLQAGNGAGKISSDDLVEEKLKALREKQETDLVFSIGGLARIRANLFLQRNTFGAALRIIPVKPQTIEDLGLPDILKSWASQPQGLVLVTGPTGSGKTTTVAAMVEYINSTRPCHIVTIEDPVEHIFCNKESIIHQREIGTDTQSCAAALRSVLRQTPDVIVIGEIRDPETLNIAITAGEIGHLVITTVHTTSAIGTIDRILNSFPADNRQQLSLQLASSLIGVTSQRLVHKAKGPGRLPAVEVMTGSPTVKKLIEDMQIGGLYCSIREGHHFGMITMNQALEKLYQSKAITYDEAILNAGNVAELRQLLRRG